MSKREKQTRKRAVTGASAGPEKRADRLIRRQARRPRSKNAGGSLPESDTGQATTATAGPHPASPPHWQVELWPIDRLVFYVRNARKNDAAVERMCGSLREFGFKYPVLARSDGEVVDGHLRLKAARNLNIQEVPVILCDESTPAQVKAFRLLVNRSAAWAEWDDDLLALEVQELASANFDLSLTGFDSAEIDQLLRFSGNPVDPDSAPPPPEHPVSRPGDLWLCGQGPQVHRLLCGDATNAEHVARLLADSAPRLMVTDPPYGISLDSEWRDRAGLNGCAPAQASYMKHRTPGHTRTCISSDTRADWSEAFALAPSLQAAYVWHASAFTREVLDGLLRIGFVQHLQIIWNKGRAVLTRTLYWFAHEPCWFVRKKNAPWYGKPGGQNTTVWESPSPKFIMGGSQEEKYDHPTQKPVELMRRPILNHTKRGELVYDPFLGSGTTLAAAELTGRVCCGLELDPLYVDVSVLRWQTLSGQKAYLDGDGRSFEELAAARLEQVAPKPSPSPRRTSARRAGKAA